MNPRFVPIAILLTGFFPTPARAHPTNPNQAIGASTIALLDISDGEIRLTLEIGKSDLKVFSDLIADGPQAIPTAKQERFFDSGFVIEAAGEPLTGRVTSIEQRKRVRRDAVTGELILNAEGSGEPVTFVEVRYPLEGRPAKLHLKPPQERSNATIGLVAYHRSIPMNDFDFFSLPVNLQLDWNDPWQSHFRGLRFQRYYNSPLWVALTVEPRQVKAEVYFRPRIGLMWLNRPDSANTKPEEIAKAAADFLAANVRVSIDGQASNPVREPIQYLRQVLAKIEPVDNPMNLTPETAIVRVSLSYPVASRPKEVSFTWQAFNPKVAEVPVWINSATSPIKLTPKEPSYIWNSSPKPDDILPIPTGSDVSSRWFLPLPSLACAAVLALWVLPGFKPFRGLKVRILTAIVLVGGTAILWPYGRANFGAAAATSEPMSDDQAARIVRRLLTDSYSAFDSQSEEAIYDTLAESVTGELLREAYLSIRRSLDAPAEVGRAHVREVNLLSVKSESQQDGVGFRAHCRWTVEVAVTHAGHTHLRNNQYEGNLIVRPVDGRWKIAAMTIVEEKRAAAQSAEPRP
jgi:hypothetical protein